MGDLPKTVNHLPESESSDVAAAVIAETDGKMLVWTEEQARKLYAHSHSEEPRPLTPEMQEAIRTYRRLTRNQETG